MRLNDWYRPEPPRRQLLFGSKSPVEQFCRVVAKKVAQCNITVKVVSPGFTETRMIFETMNPDVPRQLIDMTPLHRFGQPEEIAEVITLLACKRGVGSHASHARTSPPMVE